MATWTSKKYNRINWQNRPSTATALGATNLNRIDVFCNEVDNFLITFDAGKLDIATANNMLASVAYNKSTGVWTFKELDGTTYTFDQNIEKIPVKFSLSSNGVLTMTTEDGTEFSVNVAELIKSYVFVDSDTVSFTKTFSSADEDGKGAYHVTAIVKDGSIQERHLQPNYLADVRVAAAQAQLSQQEAESSEQAAAASEAAARDSEVAAAKSASVAASSATEAESWAVGGTGTRDGEDTDNSKYYSEQSQGYMETAKLQVHEAQEIIDSAVETINDAVANDVPMFQVDIPTGHLMYDARFIFSVRAPDGHLLWEVA